MLVTSKELFKDTQKNHYAIPAANVSDLNTMKWLIETAEEEKKPLILGLAQVHLSDELELEDMMKVAKLYAEEASVPVVLHLDHGTDEDLIKKAVDLGFSSVMIDASEDDLDTNIARTKEIVDYAHPKGVVVEAEIGHVGQGENYESYDSTDSVYTTLDEAKEFVDRTGVDSLAVSIGTAHGLYKGTPKINFERLKELSENLDTPLVLHGGSSSGDENLNRCATGGISKINIFSDFVGAAKKNLEENPTTNYVEIIKQAHDGYRDTLKHYYDVFETQTVED